MRNSFIPYGRHEIGDDDIAAVVAVLKSDWLTTGPVLDSFEQELAKFGGARYAIAVNSGTAALHGAVHAAGIGPGDEVLVPPMTFVATANSVVYHGATPVFVDVEESTLLLNPGEVEKKITPRTKAIIAVDYAGQPCDYRKLRQIADTHGLVLIADACHSLGAADGGRPCGSLADLTVFSFHPVKPIAAGEGGAVLTDDPQMASRIRMFRNHGISTDHRQRQEAGQWYYEMVDLGFNYRMTDIQASLALSQLKKLPGWISKRQRVAERYDSQLAGLEARPLQVQPGVSHGYHLYVVRIPRRDGVFRLMRAGNLGVNLHYIPVYLHPYYRKTFGTKEGLCPVAESAYREIISLPIFPNLAEADQQRVILTLKNALART